MRRFSLILALSAGLALAAGGDVGLAQAAKVCKDSMGMVIKCPPAKPGMLSKLGSALKKPAAPAKPNAPPPKPLFGPKPNTPPAKPMMGPPKPVAKPMASPAPGAKGPCKDANGKFIKCAVPSAPKKGVHCRDANGKFAKCSAPGAHPV